MLFLIGLYFGKDLRLIHLVQERLIAHLPDWGPVRRLGLIKPTCPATLAATRELSPVIIFNNTPRRW